MTAGLSELKGKGFDDDGWTDTAMEQVYVQSDDYHKLITESWILFDCIASQVRSPSEKKGSFLHILFVDADKLFLRDV